MPSWTKKPIVRAALWAAILSLFGSCTFELAARYLMKDFPAGNPAHDWTAIFLMFACEFVLLPGIAFSLLTVGRDNLEHYRWLVPLSAAALYFVVFYVGFLGHLRRGRRATEGGENGITRKQADMKRRFTRVGMWAAILATVVTGVGSAFVFLPTFTHSAERSTSSHTDMIGVALLFPGFLLDLLASNAHDWSTYWYFVPLFSWLVYFGLFYGVLRIFRSRSSDATLESGPGA